MKSNQTPIGRIPSLGYKECKHKNIFSLFTLRMSEPIDLLQYQKMSFFQVIPFKQMSCIFILKEFSGK